MVDKIVELLQKLQKDVGDLSSDVHELSDKIDNLSSQSYNNVTYGSSSVITQSNQASAPTLQDTQNANYGRKLSQVEQEYINKLKSINSSQKDIELSQYGEIVGDNFVDTATMTSATPQFAETTLHKKSVIERFFSWLAKDWPMKVGGFFVITAVGWFVTYAAAVGWLSPVARVVLGYIFAISCITFGVHRAESERSQGNTFLIIGIAAMLISTLAGLYFEIITHIVGLFVMLISVGFVTLVSLKQKSISLTSSMIFFGALIPMFFFVGVNSTTIFVYLFILTLGTLWVVSFTEWRSLTAFMLIVVGFYSITYIAIEFEGGLENISNILVAFIFAATFYIANVASIIKAEKANVYDLMTAMGIGILLCIWILTFATKEFEVFLLLISVLFFAAASYLIFTKTRQKSPTVIYGGVTAVLFAIATAIQFDGSVLVTAFLVESSAIVIITLYFARQKVTTTMRVWLTILYALPVLMSIGAVVEIFDYLDYSRGENVLDYMPELFTVFIVCITAFAVAISIVRVTNIDNKENMTFFRVFAYIGGIFALMLIWFVTHMFMGNGDVATFVSLVIYTIMGVTFYIMGIKEDYKPYRVVGGILFGIVVARVLLVDFWTMDMVMKMITSLVLGALLISTAFIKKSNK